MQGAKHPIRVERRGDYRWTDSECVDILLYIVVDVAILLAIVSGTSWLMVGLETDQVPLARILLSLCRQ